MLKRVTIVTHSHALDTKQSMGDARSLQRKSLELQAETQAFDYARQKAGDVTELFGVLAGKLRPGRQTPEESGALAGTSSSDRSVLRAQYHGASGSTVLGMANLKRIQTFLDEPRKHLGQVIADIEKEAGSFYGQVSSRRQGSGAGTQQMQRGESTAYRTEESQRICLEDVPEMNKYLGPSSRFGDGDGSFWDRWLTSTGHFTDQGNYSKADMPTRSMYAAGVVNPQSGFKRYQLDKLAFTREPEPRVLSYAARRKQGESFKPGAVPKRLRGAYSEKTLTSGGRERLSEIVLDKATEAFQISTGREQPRPAQELAEGRHRGSTSGSKRAPSEAPSSRDAHSTGREGPEEALAAINASFRTMGMAGSRKTSNRGSEASGTAMKFEPDEGASAGTDNMPDADDISSPRAEKDILRLERDDCSLEGAVASLGSVHPNYFGRQARTHVYDYFKQVSRRRHQYGDPQVMSLISLNPSDHVGAIPAYKAGLDEATLGLGDSSDEMDDQAQKQETKGRDRPHQLPPLATAATGHGKGIEGLKHEASGEPLEANDGDTADHHITSRTKYLVRCMECNVAPRAHVIIRKTRTTKVNLAHQGMGDVMGAILADCLVGLPLMRELNLRDNMLTDKGLMPIVKAIKQRHDLYALDLSENKLDRWAARELALYFSDPRCTLAKLILSKADVDDFEAANFVKHMKANKTLTYLDLSHNLIGSQESINYVRPEFYTGAEAAADWISTGSCPLKYLDLSWNTIRLDSAVYFGNAIAYATDLEELDLSFNCFGAKGGEAIGASLHVNTSLKTLGLASNAINPRACFVICQGLLQNSSIRDIDLSNNSLGKVGVGCVMALPAEVGDRIKTRLANCNFMVDCHECWFDDEQLRPSYDLRMDEPYDRAVAFHLIRRAARDQGLELKRVAHTMAGETEKEIDLVVGSSHARRNFPDKAMQEGTFRKYDKNETGSIESEDLGKALVDFGLAGENQVELLMARHDDGNEQVEESEFYDCIEESIRQSKRRERRSRAFLAERSCQDKPWMVPPEGQLRLELEYQRLHNQGYHTSPQSTDGLLAMLSGIGDGLADVMGHALNFLSLNLDQGMKIYDSVRKHVGGDKIKALAKVIPRMESPYDAHLLMSTVLSDLDERRKLRHELGPAYRPLMGTPMGHYELDLGKPMHQLAARKILEWNNLEKLARQTGTFSVFDTSQKGNWENTRNELVNGKHCRLKGTILEELPRAGTLEVDYVSTSRPLAGSGDGCDRPRKKKPMSTKKFYDVLGKLELGNDGTWINGGKTDGGEEKDFGSEDARQFDLIIDKALQGAPPRPRTRTLFEYLRFLMTDEDRSAVKQAIPARPSMMDRDTFAGSPKQPPQRRQSVPHSSGSSRPSGLPTDGLASKSVPHMATGNEQNTPPSTTGSPETGLGLGPTIGINTMACRLDELMADKWFSIRQCRFVLLVIQEAFDGDDLLQDVLVDFVVTVYPRLVDVYDFLALVGCLEDHSQAFVIKRVGWLAAWNPCRPEGYMELGLDSREERQVAKMLIHLALDQHGEYWATSSFRWAIHDPPIPGWMLPAAWHTEEGLPVRGILACTHATKPGGTRVNWVLRVALAQVVSLGGGPIPSAFGGKNNGGNFRIAGQEGPTNDKHLAVTEDVEEAPNEENRAESQGAASPNLKAFERNFDREFVDSLCRQAGSDFFLYGAQHRNVPASES